MVLILHVTFMEMESVISEVLDVLNGIGYTKMRRIFLTVKKSFQLTGQSEAFQEY